MLILPSEPPWALYRFHEMAVQEHCPGFIVLEEGIAEDAEDIIID